MIRRATWPVVVAAWLVLGCEARLGEGGDDPGASGDAGRSPAADAGSPAADAGPPLGDAGVRVDAGAVRDAGTDAGPPAMDAGPPEPEVVLVDALAGGSSGTVEGGSFVEGGGWRAGTRIVWDLGRLITRGRARVRVRDLDPGVQATAAKHHVFSLYGGDEGNHHREDAAGHGWWNVRTGTNYGSGFKFLSTPEGFDLRQEDRLIRDATWDRARTYELRVEWDEIRVRFLLDGTELVAHDHGRPTPVRYLFLGADRTYPAMPGPIYSDVEVVDLAPGSAP